MEVVVTVPPLRGLVEPLLPEGGSVTVLMKPGRSEHGYELSPEDVVRVAKADVFVYVGVGLEARVEGVLEKRGRVGAVSFEEAVGPEKVKAVLTGECTHEDHEGHHHHAADSTGDPHLWLDPVLAKDLVGAVAQRIEDAMKADKRWSEADVLALAARRDALLAKIDEVDGEYRGRLQGLQGRAIITHHDAFARLAQRYGLRVAAVVRVGGSGESSPGDIAKVVDAVKTGGARAIFREPQSDAAGVERLAERVGVRCLVLDPLGEGDWFGMMQKNLDALCEGLRDEREVTEQKDEKK